MIVSATQAQCGSFFAYFVRMLKFIYQNSWKMYSNHTKCFKRKFVLWFRWRTHFSRLQPKNSFLLLKYIFSESRNKINDLKFGASQKFVSRNFSQPLLQRIIIWWLRLSYKRFIVEICFWFLSPRWNLRVGKFQFRFALTHIMNPRLQNRETITPFHHHQSNKINIYIEALTRILDAAVNV